MPQLVTRLDEGLLGQVDALIAAGRVHNRSDAVRVALRQLVERERRRATGEAILAEYAARPQVASEVGWPDAATAALIAEEPW